MEEAREPMGAHKKVHIRKITEIEPVRKRWHEKFGRYPNEEDVERMFQNFVPQQINCLDEYSQMISGAAETVDFIKKEFGLKVYLHMIRWEGILRVRVSQKIAV